MALTRLQESQSNGEDIPTAKKRCSEPSNKSTSCLESAVAAQKWQINSLTAQNKKIITSGIEILQSDPSSDEEEGEDRKMAANKKNSNLTKTNKRKK